MELKDVLHFYIGAEIEVEYGYDNEKTIGILTGFRSAAGWEIWPYRRHQMVKEHHPYKIVRTDLLKPILRHLRDMTMEEKKAIGFDVYQVLRGAGKFNGEFRSIDWTTYQTMYLIKQKFDLFELIESGHAIDAKTL